MPGPLPSLARAALLGALLAAPAAAQPRAPQLDAPGLVYRFDRDASLPLGLRADTLAAAHALWRPAPSPRASRTAAVLGAGAGTGVYEWVRRRHLTPRAVDPFAVTYDWGYARWADKLGHAFSTGVQAQLWAAGYRWAGHEGRSAAALGAATAFAGMLYYEVLDGFDRGVGFSPPDLAANAVGAGLVAARAHVPALDAVHLKWAYWPSGDDCDATCDYEGQTTWLAVNPHRLAPEAARPFLPPWLNVAAGYGAREGDVRTGYAEHVVYLGLDLEPAGLPIQGPVWDALVPILRHVRVPAPALRLGPTSGVDLLAY
ncbi:MAG: DUF2279 domain-containing protein [Rubricoccaceae bacterium]|nr:DUF2279 domain-containing protein [Rubricoccaceae bacterium]